MPSTTSVHVVDEKFLSLDALRKQVEEVIAGVRLMLKSGVPTACWVNDERCERCSLKDICQPEALTAHTRHQILMSHLFDPDN